MTESLRAASRTGVSHITVREFAEATIRDQILNGELAPASRLNEVSIADQLGISRGPLREAIQRLASEGLLKIVPHKGAFVMGMEKDHLRELYELRIAIEAFAVMKLCARSSRSERLSIQQPLHAAKEALRGHGPYPSDVDFHRTLVTLAGNSAIEQVFRDVNTKISIARGRSAHEPRRARQAYHEHVEISDAIIAGESATAVKLLDTHLWRSFDNAVSLLLGSY